MATCTFFGHRTTPDHIRPLLKEVITDLIKTKGVTTFYIGNAGNFDHMVIRTLKELTNDFNGIHYHIVLAYLPQKKRHDVYTDFSNSLLPAGIEKVPPRFAICFRNTWMIAHSDFVITYVTHPFGGAAKFAKAAKQKGKTIINIASDDGNSPVL